MNAREELPVQNDKEHRIELIEGAEYRDIELRRGDERYFLDISQITRDPSGQLHGTVLVVDEWAMNCKIYHGQALPDQIVFRENGILDPTEDHELPKSAKALKIGASA